MLQFVPSETLLCLDYSVYQSLTVLHPDGTVCVPCRSSCGCRCSQCRAGVSCRSRERFLVLTNARASCRANSRGGRVIFFEVRAFLVTVLGLFSIFYFRGLGLRFGVRVRVGVKVRVRVRVSVVLWSG